MEKNIVLCYNFCSHFVCISLFDIVCVARYVLMRIVKRGVSTICAQEILMSASKINYEELKPFVPQNGNEENYVLLTRYLLMKGGG